MRPTALASSVLLAAAVAHAASVLGAEPGLLAHWRFDDGAGDLLSDSSGNGNDGEVYDATWVRGNFGTALHFNGAGAHVRVPQIDGLDGSDEMTVEAWVMWEGTGQYPNIITGGAWSPGGFLVFVRDKQCTFRLGRPGARAKDGSGLWRETSATLTSSIQFGRWYHLVGTYQRPVVTTYVNGEKTGSARWDFPVGHKGDLVMGRWAGATTHEGLIDDVKLYNRALSPAEVQASYDRETPKRVVEPGKKPYAAVPVEDQRGVIVATLDTKHARFEIDERGRVVAINDKVMGENHVRHLLPIASITVDGKRLRRARCTFTDGKLSVDFARSDAQVVLRLTPKGTYLVAEVLAVDGVDATRVDFMVVSPKHGKYASGSSGLMAGDKFGLCMRTLNVRTQVRLGGRPATMRGTCYKEHGLVGAKVALVAAPMDKMLDALKDVVRGEGLPQSQLGGPWSLEAEGNRGSYLFASVSEANVDDWIALVKRAGFSHVHFSGWCTTLGHYEPRKALFPKGLAGMKEAVRKIHAAGLKAGMHTLTGCISPRDSWVTPVPDKRLAADAVYTLAKPMSATDRSILTVERPGKHDTIWSYSGAGNVIRIGEELIHYSAISYEPPFGFLECTRGAFQSKPSAHPNGAPADHLRQRYIAFYPDQSSTLVGEVADCIARVYNECEMDMIYMDGSEGMGSWRGMAAMRKAIYDRLERPAIVEASAWGHHSWVFHSRIGAWDHPKYALKRFVDMHCASMEYYRRSSLLESQLGWWAITGPTWYNRGEMPDEIEYLACKVMAHDSPLSIQGVNVGRRPWNQRQNEYMTIVGWYERLRLANYFPESIRAKLREPRKDFHLSQRLDGKWQLTPTDYVKHKVTGMYGTDSWTVENHFKEQPARLRVEALYSVEPYDSREALMMEDFSDMSAFKVRGNAANVSQKFTKTKSMVKAGGVSAVLSATSRRDARRGAWSRTGRHFTTHLNMGRRSALGVWIHGDGKGEVLNIQLSNPRAYNHAYSEHYVTIDFEGWRYCELLLRERSADEYHDHQWPYFSQHGIFRTALTRAHVSELTFYLNNLPPGETATILMSPIKALRTTRTTLTNPTVEIAGRKLTFPVEMRSGRYVEYAAMDDCRLYDERGDLIQYVQPQGAAPVAEAGANRVAFSCQTAERANARAEVVIVTAGEPMHAMSPNDEIKWDLLRDEYELPRTICRFDGKQNQWDVLCRPDAGNPKVEIELYVSKLGASGANYNTDEALTLANFEELSAFADSPQNLFAKYVYDGEHKAIAVKPGVTQKLSLSSKFVKVGQSCACYTATSTRTDNGGWSAKGGRFAKPHDLSKFQAIGFWLHGDGKGESFKLQLRDQAGMWHDMVTRVDFRGWRYCEFDLVCTRIDYRQIEYMIIYYNGIPAGRSVTCYVDDVRVLPERTPLRNPAFTIAGRQIVFPTELYTYDKLMFDGGATCRILRKSAGRAETVRVQGGPIRLEPGLNRARFDAPPDSPDELKVVVSVVKRYPGPAASRQR